MSHDPTEPKIHVDEDWKARVKAEDAALERALQEEAAQKVTASGAAENSPAEKASGETGQEAGRQAAGQSPPRQLPPANFATLVAMLSTQAMAALGLATDEKGQPLPVQLDLARHFIDLLGVLEDKTRSSLEKAEARLLEETLHQLRMVYVERTRQSASGAG